MPCWKPMKGNIHKAMMRISLTGQLRLALAKAESENRQLKNQVTLHKEQTEVWIKRIKELSDTVKAINKERAANR